MKQAFCLAVVLTLVFASLLRATVALAAEAGLLIGRVSIVARKGLLKNEQIP